MRVLKYSDKKNISKEIKGKRVVLVGGCFDILHFGHIKFLEGSKKQGNCLVVALESDEFIRSRKNKKPFHNIKERAEILLSIKYVDLVIKLPFFESSDRYCELVDFIKPKVIAVSNKDKHCKIKRKLAKNVGGKVKIVSKIFKEFSSTSVIKYETILSN
ncbi:MAG: adenylyltransferase/cytidyltransferase family protein [bacterium]